MKYYHYHIIHEYFRHDVCLSIIHIDAALNVPQLIDLI